MIEIVFGALGLLGLGLALLWLIGLPGKDEEDELAGLVTANWDEIKTGSTTTGVADRASRAKIWSSRGLAFSHQRAHVGTDN